MTGSTVEERKRGDKMANIVSFICIVAACILNSVGILMLEKRFRKFTEFQDYNWLQQIEVNKDLLKAAYPDAVIEVEHESL